MKKAKYTVFIILALCSLVYLWKVSSSSSSSSSSNFENDAKELRDILKPYFVVLTEDVEFLNDEKDKINLGRNLFYDKRLSSNSNISCNSCHDLQRYGTNGDYYINEKRNRKFFRDVPSVYNVTNLELFNWDGGQDLLSLKIENAFRSPHEMDMKDENSFINRINEVKEYQEMFNIAYVTDSITFNNVINAIEVYIKGLVTPAPIDEFIAGNDNALTDLQLQGGLLFNKHSCYSCHTGSNFGGQMIQKVGLIEDWPNQKDLGYFHQKNESEYKMFFRVSPLRNIGKTAPYFHDASSNKAWVAIQKMGFYERGLKIPEDEALKIQAFLESFTGEIPSVYIKP